MIFTWSKVPDSFKQVMFATQRRPLHWSQTLTPAKSSKSRDIYREGSPVIKVLSAFLYRGRFIDFDNTFETIDEPDYIVELENDAAVGVLESKEWFEWDDDSTPLQVCIFLTFRVHSQVTFKDKTSYLDVSVSGDAFVRDQLKRFIKVGSVDFHQDDCQGNPVVTYIQRHGKAQGTVIELPNDGYTSTNRRFYPLQFSSYQRTFFKNLQRLQPHPHQPLLL